MHACMHGSLGGSRTLITQRAVGSMHYAVFRAFIIFLDLYDCKVTLATGSALLSLIAIFPRRSSADQITIPRNALATYFPPSLFLSLAPRRRNKFFAVDRFPRALFRSPTGVELIIRNRETRRNVS